MVLSWLKNQIGQKTDHPMHSLEEAQKLLADLPPEPLKALEDVTSWLTTFTTATGVRLPLRIQVTKLLDETGQPLEREVSAPVTSEGIKQFKRVQLWKAALEFRQVCAQAYGACLAQAQSEGKRGGLEPRDIALLIVRALRALAEQDKTLHLRYEPAAEDTSRPATLVCILQPARDGKDAIVRRMPIRRSVWEAMFSYYRLSETLRCENQRVTAYPHEIPTSPRQELVRALMVQAASPESMLPRQVELAALVAARFAPSFMFSQTSDADANWYCDLAQYDDEPVPTIRYFGAGVVIAKIERLVAELSTRDKLEEPLDERMPAQQQVVVLKQLLTHWNSPPPLRREPRPPGSLEFAVAHGFKAACELVLRVGGAAIELDVAADASSIAIENWLQRDAGAWGVGVAIPKRSEAWIGIGALCALRADDARWFLTIVRRLYRDSAKQQFAGLEILSKRPLFVRLRPGGSAASRDKWDAAGEALQGLLRAIILEESAKSGMCHELLVARGDFVPGAVYDVLWEDATLQLRMDEELEQGEDFELGTFTWLE